MIYTDLDDAALAGMLRPDETGWQAVSAAILESHRGFPDTTLIEGLWLSDAHCADAVSQFDPSSDRSAVSFGQVEGREHCVEADSDHSITLFYRDAACRAGRNAYEEFSPHKPSTFQPRCLVVLIEPESRAALRDELVQAGRVLTDYLRVQVNYTTTLSANPDLGVASSNCALGLMLKKLHEADLEGQRERDALAWAQANLTLARQQYTLFKRTLDGLSAWRPPAAPPPPPPPRYQNAPPGAPAIDGPSIERALLPHGVAA